MAIDRRLGKKLPEHYQRDNIDGVRLSSGPYIGIVKNNVDPAFRGRLQVFIPDLGGDENNHTHWRIVNYASPFWGSTHQITSIEENKYKTTAHTYGMWFVPPDIGNWVLVTFASGDPNQGYWFACVPSNASHHMVPAIGSSNKIEQDTNLGVEAKQLPVVEFNEVNETLSWDNIKDVQKPVHEDQLRTLLEQGLELDVVRGTVTSSSQRETPSAVFGISTPGRALTNTANAKTTRDKTVTARKGGHTFVLDDGDVNGKDQLVRLRTAGGHQILMHDTEGTIYIANKDGKVWLEFAQNGKVFLYANDSLNIRAEGDINIHAGADINMQADSEIKMYAAQQLKAESKDINVYAGNNLALYANNVGSYRAGTELVYHAGMIYLNTKDGIKPKTYQEEGKFDKPYVDVSKSGQQWKATSTFKSILTEQPPTHEPFPTHTTQGTLVKVKTTIPTPQAGVSTSSQNTSQTTNQGVPESGSYEDKAVAIIKREEGFPKGGRAYPDPAGQTTLYAIGYGHQITEQEKAQGYIDLGNNEKIPLADPVTDTKMTQEQSEKLLKIDLPRYTQSAKGPLGDEAWGKLDDNQKAALTSYSYNTGSTKSLVKNGLRDEILAGNTQGAADIISNKGIKTSGGNYLQGLADRRSRESNIFAAGTINTSIV